MDSTPQQWTICQKCKCHFLIGQKHICGPHKSKSDTLEINVLDTIKIEDKLL